MLRFCDRCDKRIYDDELVHVRLAPDIDRWICTECATRLYHWFKMECHRYDCDEVTIL